MSYVVKISDRAMQRVTRIQEKMYLLHGFKPSYMEIISRTIEAISTEDVFAISLDISTEDVPPAEYAPTSLVPLNLPPVPRTSDAGQKE